MKKLNGFEKARTLGEPQEQLPVGGYILKILDVKFQNYEWGDVIVLAFDIAEGEYAGFYKKNFDAQTQEDKKWKGTYRMNVPKDDGSKQDEFTMSKFKTDIEAIEDSNSGYHWDWDESKFKGKTVGAVFQNREWEMNGNTGFYTACYGLKSTEAIRSGKFKIPKDKLLKKKEEQTTNDGFIPLDDDGEEPIF